MFERFTPASRAAVLGARAAAASIDAPTVGTVHLLVGVVELEDDPAGAVLRAAGLDAHVARAAAVRWTGIDGEALRAVGIDLDAVRAAADATFGPGALSRRVPRGRRRSSTFGPGARTALELSLREALRLGHRGIEPGHVLLGVLRRGSGLGHELLTAHGVGRGDLEAALPATTRS